MTDTAAASITPWKLEFAHPRYWGIWLMMGFGWLITRLPHRARLAVGRGIGWAGYHLARDRRNTVAVNLRLCFPEMPAVEREALGRQVFASVGMSIVETAVAWLVPREKYAHLFTCHNLDALQAAQAEGKGVLFLGMHLATLDIAGVGLSNHIATDVMYRPNKNKLLDAFMTGGRMKNFPDAIHRDDIKQVIRNLRRGHIVWYGADQDYGARHSVFAPFFGVPAATIKATARIARMTRSPVVVFTHYRRADNSGYDLYMERLTTPFPVEDEVDNATIVNQVVEAGARRQLAQYWWVHRRFKTRPPGEARPY